MAAVALAAAGAVAQLNPQEMPPPAQGVDVEERLGEMLPLDLSFRNAEGEVVSLDRYFTGDKPVVMALVYYECPMLCTQVLTGVVSTLKVIPLSIGEDFDVVTISFDPDETPALAAARKAEYVQRYGREGAARGWQFLTGSSRSIAAVTKAVGFRYAYNEGIDQFAHVSGFMVLTPDGRLSRYFYGIEYGPRDVRLALVEAADRRIGTLADLSGKVNTADIDGKVLTTGAIDVKQYAIPTGVNAFSLVVSPTEVETAGQKLPDDTKWTWEEYVDLASKITDKSGGKIYGVPWDLDPGLLYYRADIVEVAPLFATPVAYPSSLVDEQAFAFRGLTRTSDGFFVKLSYLLRF